MFQNDSVCNAWNAGAFIVAYRGQKRSRRYKQYFLPLSGHKFWQDIGCSVTAAQPQPLPPECVSCRFWSKISIPQSIWFLLMSYPCPRIRSNRDTLPNISQISGDDPGVVIRLPSEIFQVADDGVTGCRRHTGTHILGIF